MRKFTLALVLGAALAAGATLSVPAQATPAGALGPLNTAAGDLNMIEQAQYVWGGRRYCWYAIGWKGPGWYRCGYAARRGYGWGGPVGWRGWYYGPRPGYARGRYYWGGRYYHNRYWRGGRWRYR